MEIFLNKRAMRQVRLSVADAIEDGEIDALREDLVSVFSDDDIEEIERRIDSGDFYDFISEILDEWSGEDLDELMELLETQLSDADIDLKYTAVETDDSDTDEEEEEDDDDDTDDDLLVDDDDDEI
jgi:predicted AlkP superfamily pyrophosphatase or phosphodiesterase